MLTAKARQYKLISRRESTDADWRSDTATFQKQKNKKQKMHMQQNGGRYFVDVQTANRRVMWAVPAVIVQLPHTHVSLPQATCIHDDQAPAFVVCA
jgi:hypothetical protein